MQEVALHPILLSLLFTCLGAVLSFVVQFLYQKHQFKQELKSNNNIDITGNSWFAAWQTSVAGNEVLNTENLSIEQRGGVIKMKNLEKGVGNPDGGYLWSAQLQFYYGRDLLGWYFPNVEENNTSKGIMFLNYNAPQKIFMGKWVGSAYDGPLQTGFVVIASERDKSLSLLKDVISRHSNDLVILSQGL